MDKSLTPLGRFLRLLKPDMPDIRNIYIYAIFSGLISLSLPLGIQAIVNLIQGGEVNTAWIVLVTFVVIGVAITGVLQVMQLRITENLQQKIFARSAFELAYRIPHIRLDKLYGQYPPELMNRFFDTISVQKALPKILIDFSTAAFSIAFGLVLLSIYHPFFIFFSVVLILIAFGIIRFSAASGLRTSLQESKFKYKVAHWLEEVARTSITFKLIGKPDLSLRKVDTYVEEYLGARESHFRILVRQYGHLVMFKVLVAAGLLAIGGILVMQERMNIGQFVAAEIIVLLVMSSVEKIIVSMETIYDLLTSLEKIGEVTDLELETNDPVDEIARDVTQGMSIQFRNVSFNYPDQDLLVLDDVDLSVGAGEVIAVAGPSGAGKSTLIQLMAALYNPVAGNMLFDNVPVGNIGLDNLRAEIGDCLSQEQIFEGTILENITMGRKSVTIQDVDWAVRNVGLDEYVADLANGYHTQLQPHGKTLARSVAQQILIARAIVDRPRLLLMENVFENLDPDLSVKIIDFLTSKQHSWTVVLVTAEPKILEKCGRVIMMEQGRVLPAGKSRKSKTV